MFGFRIIPQANAIVIERLGKFNRIAYGGLTFIIPFLETTRPIFFRALDVDVDGTTQIITKRSELIDLREQVLDFPKQNVITKDNVTMEIDAVIYYHVEEPEKTVYGIANLVDGIEKLVQTTLRNVVGQLTLDETLSSRETINASLKNIMDDTTPEWGVRINRVEIQEISPPEDIRLRMELQMTAEREKRANILKAEGDKQAAVLEAEGEASAEIRKAEASKQARILEAEGIAQARRTMAQAEAEALEYIEKRIERDKATEYMLALKYMETLQTIGDGKATKLFMPYEAAGVLGALGGVREMLAGVASAGGDDTKPRR